VGQHLSGFASGRFDFSRTSCVKHPIVRLKSNLRHTLQIGVPSTKQKRSLEGLRFKGETATPIIVERSTG
ncbi:MAG TPA: hypothetical protein VEU51_06685, partial [Candidatus Acidoferrales bacterium]|nr:hypothetical protein [Candidatus Acidoferrales bacterium]